MSCNNQGRSIQSVVDDKIHEIEWKDGCSGAFVLYLAKARSEAAGRHETSDKRRAGSSISYDVPFQSCSQSHVTKVSYDSAKVKPEQVFAAFKKAGVKVEGQQIELAVNGMACGSCSTKLSKALTKLDGVLTGSACHQSKKATVLFDPAKLKSEQIVAAINKTGFKVADNAPAAN